MAPTMTLNDDLRRVLWACYAYWQTEPVPEGERQVCFFWVEGKYKARFGETFHQTKLATLAKLGFLAKGDDARGGNRRYYTLKDPQAIRDLTAELDQG